MQGSLKVLDDIDYNIITLPLLYSGKKKAAIFLPWPVFCVWLKRVQIKKPRSQGQLKIIASFLSGMVEAPAKERYKKLVTSL
jgi:hypothetical protein